MKNYYFEVANGKTLYDKTPFFEKSESVVNKNGLWPDYAPWFNCYCERTEALSGSIFVVGRKVSGNINSVNVT